MYLSRKIEEKIRNIGKHFKIVCVLGAKQVGKKTLLSHLFPNDTLLTLDPIQDILKIRQDPDLFLKNMPTPLILDEVQYIPEIFPSLKRKVDQTQGAGLYFLTGSQNLFLSQRISESLAGRVGIIELGTLTPFEQEGVSGELSWLECFLDQSLSQKKQSFFKTTSQSLWDTLWRGQMPGTLNLSPELIPTYFSSYIQTYIERDVRFLENIQNLKSFSDFLSLNGILSSQELNRSQRGRELGLSATTAHRWLNALVLSYVYFEIPAYFNHALKRISKKPKTFLFDTGLICYLHRISSPEALAGHPYLGSLFETLCVNMIRHIGKSMGTSPGLYHWRNQSGKEVDLILERDGFLFLIEFKCRSYVDKNDTKGIHAFIEAHPHIKIGGSAVVYAGEEIYLLKEKIWAIPWNSFWKEQ